jgi:hypothetical protein
VRQSLWIRLTFSAVALIGAVTPLLFVLTFPQDLPFLSLVYGPVCAVLALYLLFIRTRGVSIAVGTVIAVFAIALPIPGYPVYFGFTKSGFAAQALLLFGIAPLALITFLVGLVVDLGQRVTAARRAERVAAYYPVPRAAAQESEEQTGL